MSNLKSPNFNITLYTTKGSLTIYFDKDGGVSMAKNYATRIANALKHKVTDIVIKYQSGDTEYPIAYKKGDNWDSHPDYDMWIKKFHLQK